MGLPLQLAKSLPFEGGGRAAGAAGGCFTLLDDAQKRSITEKTPPPDFVGSPLQGAVLRPCTPNFTPEERVWGYPSKKTYPCKPLEGAVAPATGGVCYGGIGSGDLRDR